MAHTESKCWGCEARILWAVTVNGKMQPLNPEPDICGNLRLLEEFVATPRGVLQRVVVKGDALEFGDDGVRYMPHHATCPEAGRFRKPVEGRSVST